MSHYLKRITWLAATLFACLAITQTAQAASFDCAKAKSKVEKLICGDEELSKLDDELGKAYTAALANKSQTASIKKAQKRWVKKLNACADAACVREAYEARLPTLTHTVLAVNVAAKNDAEQGRSYADDYMLDPAPKEMIDWNWEEYEKPRDKEVCSLYLQNLQYFARRNEPMSCGQLIAPMLQDKIKKAEWENLDPKQYPDLFKEIIKVVHSSGKKEPSEKEMERWRMEIKERGVVFRRLKFNLKGSPGVEEISQRPLPERELNVVQFGSDVTNSNNPDWVERCHPLRGRIMDNVQNTELRLFIVAKDLSHIFGRLRDWRGHSGQNLWLINERMYGEFYDEHADVKITELRNTDFTKELVLEPVCLYHFNKTSHKE